MEGRRTHRGTHLSASWGISGHALMKSNVSSSINYYWGFSNLNRKTVRVHTVLYRPDENVWLSTAVCTAVSDKVNWKALFKQWEKGLKIKLCIIEAILNLEVIQSIKISGFNQSSRKHAQAKINPEIMVKLLEMHLFSSRVIIVQYDPPSLRLNVIEELYHP